MQEEEISKHGHTHAINTYNNVYSVYGKNML